MLCTLEEKAQVKALHEQAKKCKTLAVTVDGNDNGGDTWVQYASVKVKTIVKTFD